MLIFHVCLKASTYTCTGILNLEMNIVILQSMVSCNDGSFFEMSVLSD